MYFISYSTSTFVSLSFEVWDGFSYFILLCYISFYFITLTIEYLNMALVPSMLDLTNKG